MKKSKSLTSKVAGMFIAVLLLGFLQRCILKKDARVTVVYGKITDQTGLAVDSVTVIMYGGKSLSSGAVPIGRTNSNINGEYELVVDVPKAYSSVDAGLHFSYKPLLDKYYEQLIFQDGIQQNSCCRLSLGSKRNYDFVLLPK